MRDPATRSSPETTGLAAASLLAMSFLAVVLMLAALGKVPWLTLPVCVAMSLLTFCAYAFDKSAAMNRRFRISEQSLHLLSLAGGWPGALIAQRMFHHKSKKPGFQMVFWLIVAIHLALVLSLATGFPFKWG